MTEELTKKQMIEDEVSKILACEHDFYGENPPLKKDSTDVVQESLFCKKCGNHFIRIIAVLSKNINKTLWKDIIDEIDTLDLCEILRERGLIVDEKEE